MRWSWKLGRFAGVNAYVHASFALLLLWAAFSAYSGTGTVLAVVMGVMFLLAVFGSVLLHELGHAVVARRFGILTRRIVLLPIGGIAQLEGEPRTPRQELAIALAGPAVNLLIAGLLAPVVWLVGLPAEGLLGSLLVANLGLALFNLLPAFPMDGGRALRALLATRVGLRDATRTAVTVAKVVAIAFGIVGLFTNWMLTVIAVFVWFASDAEARRHLGGRGGGRGLLVDPPSSPWSADPLDRDHRWFSSRVRSREPWPSWTASSGTHRSPPVAPQWVRQVVFIRTRPR